MTRQDKSVQSDERNGEKISEKKGMSTNENLLNMMTNPEIIRLVDLALRRLIDNGIENYGPEDQKIAVKLQEIKEKFGKTYGDLL